LSYGGLILGRKPFFAQIPAASPHVAKVGKNDSKLIIKVFH